MVGGDTPAKTFNQGGQMYVYNDISVRYNEKKNKKRVRMYLWYWYVSMIVVMLLPHQMFGNTANM
jgi:hypothetical protein